MLISFFVILLLWHSAYDKFFGFTYTDEIITLLLGLYLIFSIITKKFRPCKYEKNAMIFIIVFYATGLCATLIYNFQNNILYGMGSGLFSIKAFICFFGTRACLQNKEISQKKLCRLLKFVEIPLLPISVLLIIDQFNDFFPYAGMRFGIKCSLFIFTHPTELAGFAICSLLLSCFIREILSLKKKYFLNYIPAIIMIFISGRYKALGFITLFAGVNIILPFMKNFKLRYFVIGIPAAMLVVYDQIIVYFSDLSLTARGMLYKNSFLIAKDFFPLGTGFATYGTEYSRASYSTVYYMYHMQNIYGLAPTTPFFVCDTMWPAILGETGILGLLAITGMFYCIVRLIQNANIINKRVLFILYAMLIYLMIESVAETIFMNPKGCLILIILAFMISVGKMQVVFATNYSSNN